MDAVTFDANEKARYARQMLMPEWGTTGQRRLKQSQALIVGLGGLGSPVALYLAAAGMGRLTIVDFDTVDESNLQRQVMFSTSDVGRLKTEAAAARLRAINPHVELQVVAEPFGAGNGLELVRSADVVLDGTDNFATRFLVNDACVLGGRPNVFGSVARFEGQVSVFAEPTGPCYRCLHPEPPPDGLIPNCGDAGVLGVLPGVIGMLQATEALKLVAGVGTPLVGRLLIYDAWRMRIREIHLPRDPECPVCGVEPSIRSLKPYQHVCMSDGTTEMAVSELEEWRRSKRPHVLIDVRDPSEHAAASIPEARLLPLPSLGDHVARLPTDRPVVVHCQTGVRSARAVRMLRAKGLDARSLRGGIQAWLLEVRPD